MRSFSTEIGWNTHFDTPFLVEYDGITEMTKRVNSLITMRVARLLDVKQFTERFRDQMRRIDIQDGDLLAIFLYFNGLPKGIRNKIEANIALTVPRTEPIRTHYKSIAAVTNPTLSLVDIKRMGDYEPPY